MLSIQSAQAIELIINGKNYHIDSYQIENNGQRLVIPNVPIKERKPSAYEGLLNDLEGGYESLKDSLETDPHRSKTSRRNFR